MTTIDGMEQSKYQGRPGECYRFATGERVWTWTSAQREMSIPAGRFRPETIRRSGAEYSQEDNTESIEVTVPRNNPVAALCIPIPPTPGIGLTIYRGPRDTPASFTAVWTGKVTSARLVGSEAVLRCATVAQSMKREFPTVAYQRQCPLVTYSAECGANATAFRDIINVTSISGRVLTSAGFGLRADGWFANGGFVIAPDGTQRFITDHVGNDVTLLAPFLDLNPLDDVQAFRGDDRSYETCRDVFGRLDSHLGFHLIPSRDPFKDRID